MSTRIAAISPDPTDEEVAAIVAAFAALDAESRARIPTRGRVEHLSVWVDASRRAAQRSGLQRGPWRLSGRIARRSRA